MTGLEAWHQSFCGFASVVERLRPQLTHVECEDGPVQALKGKLADRLELGHALDRGVHLAVDQDLAALGLVAQARGKVRDRASHRILKAPLEADAAERRIAVGDADAEAKLVAVLAPSCRQTGDAVPHLDRHANGP